LETLRCGVGVAERFPLSMKNLASAGIRIMVRPLIKRLDHIVEKGNREWKLSESYEVSFSSRFMRVFTLSINSIR